MPETKKYLPILLVIGFSGLLVPLSSFEIPSQVGGAYLEALPPLPQFPIAPEQQIPRPKHRLPISKLKLQAKSVLVKDLNFGIVIYEKNSQEALPMASLAKLMTALLVVKRVDPDDIVKIEAQDLKVPLYRADLAGGEKLRVIDLLAAMLISSANDATYALARYAGGTLKQFVAEMNKEARALGMATTVFTNPSGFDEQGQYSTAGDLAKLVEEFLLNPELLKIVRQKQAVITSVDGRWTHKLSTTNKLMLKYEEIVGLKTGYTSEAGGNLIILVQEGKSQYYSIILGSLNREAETEKVMTWVKENWTWTPLDNQLPESGVKN